MKIPLLTQPSSLEQFIPEECPDNLVWNDLVEKFYGDLVPKSVYEEFLDTVNIQMEASDEDLTEDEIEGIAYGVESIHFIRKDEEKRKSENCGNAEFLPYYSITQYKNGYPGQSNK